jgi:O-antigen ligase
MRKLTGYLLWVFVFTVPWDNFPLPIVGSVSRVFGLAVVGAAVLTMLVEARFRKPDAVLGFATAFSVWGALSLLWTISPETTVVMAATLAQSVAGVWVIREFVRTREQVQPLLVAICLGLFVPLVDLMNNFRLNVSVNRFEGRFSGSGLNADRLGMYLVLGLPIAWHLLMTRRGIVRVIAAIYFLAAPVGLLLTGTRGSFLAGVVGCVIVPLTLPRFSLRSYALGVVLVTTVALSAALVVPRTNWNRIVGITSELTEGGSLAGRKMIWQAAVQVFPERPILGVGFGAFLPAVNPLLKTTRMSNAHNLALGLLVEDGILGLCLFAGILVACARTIVRLPPPHRVLWGTVGLTWLVVALAASPETVKFTWVLIGLISAQSGLPKTVPHISPIEEASRTASDSLRPVTV